MSPTTVAVQVVVMSAGVSRALTAAVLACTLSVLLFPHGASASTGQGGPSPSPSPAPVLVGSPGAVPLVFRGGVTRRAAPGRFVAAGSPSAGSPSAGSPLAEPPTAQPSPGQKAAKTTATMAVTARSVHEGDEVTLSGSGFAPGAHIVISFHSSPVVVGSTTADDAGDFAVSVAVPGTASGGQHHFEAQGSPCSSARRRGRRGRSCPPIARSHPTAEGCRPLPPAFAS